MEKAFKELEPALAQWGLSLSQEQRGQISRYLDLLLKYNLKVNLTAETDPKALLLRHVADGLAAIPLLKESLPNNPAPRILDLGSGGGFIGISIKIAWPEARVTLMEALQRKYDFLNIAAVSLGLKGLRVLKKTAGVQTLAGADTGYDAVIARALAPLPEAVALGLPLAAPGGFFIAYQSDPPDPNDEALKKTLSKLSAELARTASYRLPGEERDRHLALLRPCNLSQSG